MNAEAIIALVVGGVGVIGGPFTWVVVSLIQIKVKLAEIAANQVTMLAQLGDHEPRIRSLESA